jgi:hypothetical protein
MPFRSPILPNDGKQASEFAIISNMKIIKKVGIQMNDLFLDNDEKKYLHCVLQVLEAANGSDLYSGTLAGNEAGCKHYDCFVSCNCANSRD